MKTIYKYELSIIDMQTILLPHGYEILSIQVKDGKPYVWALIDTTSYLVTVNFITIGTGNPIYDESIDYISTYKLSGFVWHVFKSKN